MTLSLIQTLVLLLALAGFAARVIGIPYPVLLVLVGLGLALVPGVPRLTLEPDVILFVFLPPLLFRGAFHAPLRELIGSSRSLLILALPGVVITALLVALPVHYLAGLPWGAALVLGATVAPTDPIAALAIFRTLGAPPRLAALVEGESLLNDGTGLVLYRIIVAAVATGAFVPARALRDFVVVAGGGILVGLAIGWVALQILRRVDDPRSEMTLHLAIAYGSYLVAEKIHVSGVLATVCAAVVLGARVVNYTGTATRLTSAASWEVVEFIANALLFLGLGLQLRRILDELGDVSVARLALATAVTVVATVAARFAMTFGSNALVRLVHAVRPLKVPPLPVSWLTVLSASGLRGGLTLALALALPLTVAGDAPFPERNLLQFLTFGTVIFTLVPFSLLLPALLRRLGLTGDRQGEIEELTARRAAARAALAALARGEAGELDADTRGWLTSHYRFEVNRFGTMLAEEHAGEQAEEVARFQADRTARLRLLDVERQTVAHLQDEYKISVEAATRALRSIDLEAEGLRAEAGPDPEDGS